MGERIDLSKFNCATLLPRESEHRITMALHGWHAHAHANTYVYFQLLDADGMMLQTMRFLKEGRVLASVEMIRGPKYENRRQALGPGDLDRAHRPLRALDHRIQERQPVEP